MKKWIAIILTTLLCAVIIFVIAVSIHINRAIDRDGGYGCTIDWEFFGEARLAQSHDDRVRDGWAMLSFTYGSDLIGRVEGADPRFGPYPLRVLSRVFIQNIGSKPIPVSLGMELKSEGVTSKPIELRNHTELKKVSTNSNVTSFNLEPGVDGAAFFYFAPELLNEALPHQTLEQTVFIGELEPTEILATQKLTRVTKAYNCIFGKGYDYRPG